MTLGGLIVVGTTALVAVLDGGFSGLVAAAALGGGTYVSTRRVLNALPERILRTQERVLEAAIRHEMEKQAGSGELDEGKIKTMQKEAKAAKDGAREVRDEQRWGNKEVAAIVGLASFAYPPLGVVALASGLATEAGWFDKKEEAPSVNWEAALRAEATA